MILKGAVYPEIGELTWRGTFMFPTRVSDGMGGTLTSEDGSNYRTVWAKFTQLSGRELMKAGRLGSAIMGELIVPYDYNLQSGMLWKFSNYMTTNTWRIVSMENMGFKDMFWKLLIETDETMKGL